MGGSSTGGSSPGGSSPGGSSPGGSGGSDSNIAQLLETAQESCELLDMTVVVKFADEALGARLTGRVVDGSLAVEGEEEVLEQQARLGHVVRLRWADGVADGAQVPVSGWVEQSREPDSSRYRCFDGEVRVRVNDGGDVFYVFAADAVSDATADGTCGAPTAKEEVYGCLPADY